MKKIPFILLAAMLLGTPTMATSFSAQEESGVVLSSINIASKGKSIHVTGANGMTMEIFNLTGVRIATVQIDSNDTKLNVGLSKGCYIFKIGKVVRKISIS